MAELSSKRFAMFLAVYGSFIFRDSNGQPCVENLSCCKYLLPGRIDFLVNDHLIRPGSPRIIPYLKFSLLRTLNKSAKHLCSSALFSVWLDTWRNVYPYQELKYWGPSQNSIYQKETCQEGEFSFLCNLFPSKSNLKIYFRHSHSSRHKKGISFNTVCDNCTGLSSVCPKFMLTWNLRTSPSLEIGSLKI